MLDETHIKFKGRPQSESLDNLSKKLKIGKDKVRIKSIIPGLNEGKMLTRLLHEISL